jgi:hypothetical protein
LMKFVSRCHLEDLVFSIIAITFLCLTFICHSARAVS